MAGKRHYDKITKIGKEKITERDLLVDFLLNHDFI